MAILRKFTSILVKKKNAQLLTFERWQNLKLSKKTLESFIIQIRTKTFASWLAFDWDQFGWLKHKLNLIIYLNQSQRGDASYILTLKKLSPNPLLNTIIF